MKHISHVFSSRSTSKFLFDTWFFGYDMSEVMDEITDHMNLVKNIKQESAKIVVEWNSSMEIFPVKRTENFR